MKTVSPSYRVTCIVTCHFAPPGYTPFYLFILILCASI